jgi:hypothetical protein
MGKEALKRQDQGTQACQDCKVCDFIYHKLEGLQTFFFFKLLNSVFVCILTILSDKRLEEILSWIVLILHITVSQRKKLIDMFMVFGLPGSLL